MAANRIRTRFAPSPTGYMHVGNLRTALYAYLIAKHEDGDFLLRIEDTDQERYVEGAIDVIFNTLKETGLHHDEGPDIGGDFGPYIQSERRGIYLDYAKELVNKGEAYYCFCDKERLDSIKQGSEESKDVVKYDKYCLNLSKEDVDAKLAEGIPYVIRQNNPTTGETKFNDVIYGEISVDNSELEDMILIKSDGLPTYNFANVVDDHLMGITHVVRGSEYLSSSPKYNRLYDAFGWPVPVYVHCPPIMKDAHNKLSKRNGDASFQDLIAKGYLKEAVLNYIALLGWNPGTNQEIFSLKELVETFDYKNINKSPAIFDINKLTWMNSEYIKALSPEKFNEFALPFYKETLKGDYDFAKISSLLQNRCETLNDIPNHIDFLDTLPEYSIDLYLHKKMKSTVETSINSLEAVIPVLSEIATWEHDAIHDKVFELIKEMEIKNGQMLWPIRTALSGKAASSGGAFDLAELLGKAESLKRLEIGLDKLKNA